MALEFAPFGVLLNKKFFLPITKGLMERSLRLLSISNRPSSKNTISLCHCFRQYLTALPSALFGSTFGVCSFSHAEKASRIGWLCSNRISYLFSGVLSKHSRSIANNWLQYSSPLVAVRRDWSAPFGKAFSASSKYLRA